MNSLKKRVVIVTGGASGIGRATAKQFAGYGSIVVIWDLNKERGEDLANEIKEMGQNAVFYSVNTTNSSEIKTTVDSIIEKYGKIDVLINNAGITKDASLLKMTDEQWDQVIDVNLKGVFNCTKIIAPIMVQNGFGRIINASSVVGLYGNFGQTNYAATKAGVIAMTKTWAKELGKKGINVNAVAPGFILTEMVQAMPEAVLDKMKEKVPLNKLGTPEDIANIYCFLASDMANYINGATISVDGGITL